MVSAESKSHADITRCDRCSRPATRQVAANYFREHRVSGAFCGRHAVKSGLPCVQLTSLFFKNLGGHVPLSKDPS